MTHDHAPAGNGPPITLADLKPGDSARIVGYTGTPGVAERLRDLGLREGELVVMIKRAPLADPVEYCVQGVHLGLRRAEAAEILVADVEPTTRRHRARRRRGWGGGRAPSCGPAAPRS
jgi:ferrous iron transport protein A